MAFNYRYQYDAELFKARLAQISDVDIAWFSGWLCADGSIVIKRKKRGRIELMPCISFTISDRDPLDRFVLLFGRLVYGPYNPKSSKAAQPKPLYRWHLPGMKAVYLLERCLPWLSIRYREKATQALQYKQFLLRGNLTPTLIEAIKSGHLNGKRITQKELARQFHISTATMANIRLDRLWRVNGVTERAIFDVIRQPGYFDNPNNFHPDELMNL